MGLSGKYDFKGIQKMGGAAIRVALSSTPYTAWFVKVPGSNFAIELMVNWLANRGLIFMNLGAIAVDSEVNQHALDSAFQKAIDEIQIKGGRDALTVQQKKSIDDEVIKAARKFIVINNNP